MICALFAINAVAKIIEKNSNANELRGVFFNMCYKSRVLSTMACILASSCVAASSSIISLSLPAI